MPSILAGYWSEQLLNRLPHDHVIGTYNTSNNRNITFTIRRRSKTSAAEWRQLHLAFGRKIVLTGGLQLTASINSEACGVKKFVVNLKRGWDKNSFRRTFNRLADKVLKEKHRLNIVDQCYRYSKQFENNPLFLASVEKHALECKRPIEFDMMSYEDAEYWLAWLPRWYDFKAA